MPSYTPQNAFQDVAEFEHAAMQALRILRRHVEQSTVQKTPATGWAPMPEILAKLNIDGWIASGGMERSSFAQFLDGYLEHSVQFRHPGYIAHQVSVPDYPAALGAMVNGLTNNPMGLYEMGPAAAAIEFAVINWMLRKIGWPEQPVQPAHQAGVSRQDTGGGVMTHGGSLANLTALLAARARIAPDAWEQGNPDDLAVLVPASSHYSNARSISVLGLGRRAVYPVEVTRLGVIKPDKLHEALRHIRRDGKRCMALTANACSTATGLHDPLRAIGEFCQQHEIWFHVDACHGASALMCPSLRHYLDGIELADSVVWDTHKMMQVPVLSAAVLLKNVHDFERAFDLDASYLATDRHPGNYDTLKRTVECTRSAMGLKVFLNLAWRGEAALGAYVKDRYEVTARFYEQIKSRTGFECPYEPETNILCFRYGDSDAEQERIREQLLQDGSYHITSALIDGKKYLRLTVMNKLTNAATIDGLLEAIESA